MSLSMSWIREKVRFELCFDDRIFESCSHLVLSCLLWSAAVLETAKTLVRYGFADSHPRIKCKKTRCYAIKKSDVIAFMNDREINPEKYIAPKNWYKYGSEMVRPYKIRIHPPCAKDEKKLRRYYESKLAALPDVMDVAAVDFTGYNRRTVCQWIRVGKLKALALLQKYMIPKCYLIDWLCSDDYNNTNRKSRRHIDMLWEAQKWRD